MDIITIPAHHTSNSYTTLAKADEYISLFSETGSDWSGLTEDQQKYALVLAALYLNSFSYRGKKVTKNQNLAFPRHTQDQLNNFYAITYTEIIEDEDINITDNKLVSAGSIDLFATAIDNEDLVLNQVIKVSGISGKEYLTITDMDADGNWIEVKEDLTNDTGVMITLLGMDIFGVPENIEFAQIEVARQVINTKMFQKEIGEAPDGAISSFSLTGALSIKYSRELLKRRNKFEESGPLDVIYNWLNPWLSGIRGGIV